MDVVAEPRLGLIRGPDQSVTCSLLSSDGMAWWTIEASSDLTRWRSLGDLAVLNAEPTFLDQRAAVHEHRFYRAVSPAGDVAAALQRQRQRWAEAQVTGYRFTFQWHCFCRPDQRTPVTITVRAGAIASVVRVEDGIALDPASFSQYPKIEELLAFLQEAIDQHAESVYARFDPMYGYPEEAFVDYFLGTADEEQGFTVKQWEVLEAVPLVQLTERTGEGVQLDAFTLSEVRLEGSTLWLKAQFGGGCDRHDFELFMSPPRFEESVPPQASLYLRHDGHGDRCRALLIRDLAFDVSPVLELYRQHYGHSDPILLNVFGYFDDGVRPSLTVLYQPR